MTDQPSKEKDGEAPGDEAAEEVPEKAFDPGKRVEIDELMRMDKDDASLARYKAQLLGQSADGVIAAFPDDLRHVIFTKFEVVFRDKDIATITFPLRTEQDLASIPSLELPEGAEYAFRVTFCVQRKIVSGLAYVNDVKRMGVRVSRERKMMGSFAPTKDPHTYQFGWQTVPSGFLARSGHYTTYFSFIDDDQCSHLTFSQTFTIRK